MKRVRFTFRSQNTERPTTKESKDRLNVILTWAQSIDGSLAASSDRQLLLSGDESMMFTHRLRRHCDSIAVGVNTVVADNPSLTVRLVEGENPRPVIFDSSLRTPLDCKLLSKNEKKPVILCVRPSADVDLFDERKKRLQALGAHIIECKGRPISVAAVDEGNSEESAQSVRKTVDLIDALERLARPPHNLRRMMIEGGPTLLRNALESHLSSDRKFVSRVIVTISPVLVGGVRLLDGLLDVRSRRDQEDGDHSPSSSRDGFPRLRDVRTCRAGDDIIMSGTLG